MSNCPFCQNQFSENQTCEFCGYSLVLALPFHPTFKSSLNYFFLAIASIFFAIISLLLNFFSELAVISPITFITSISFAGITLEKIPSKFNCFHIRLLAILGIILAAGGYITFILFRSHLPGIGYSM